MANRSRDRYQALVLHEERVNNDTLQARGAGATDSSYTQASTVAGVPEPTGDPSMVLQASGPMTDDTTFQVDAKRAGMPGIDGASYVFREGTSGDWYGHDGPQVITGWDALISDTGTLRQVFPAAITLATGEVMAAVSQVAADPYNVSLQLYDPDDSGGSWSAVPATPQSSQHIKGPGLLQLPSGKILLFVTADGGQQVDVLQTDDKGSTWSIAAERVLSHDIAQADIRRIAVAYSAGQIVMLVSWWTGSAYNMAQFASYDLGARFERVDSSFTATAAASDEPASPVVLALRAGGFLAGWQDRASGALDFRVARLAVASDVVASLTHQDIAAGAAADNPALAMYEARSGEVYAFCHDGGSSSGDLTVYRSIDSGDSFTKYEAAAQFVDPTDASLYHYTAAEAGGTVCLLTRWTGEGNSYANDSVACVYLGGYSQHTLPAQGEGSRWLGTDYMAWGKNQDEALPWLPLTLPHNLDNNGGSSPYWAQSTSGTASESLTAAGMNVTTTSGTDSWEFAWTKTAETLMVEFAVRVNSGGSVSSDDVAVRIEWGDGSSYAYDVSIRLTTTTLRLYDNHAAATKGSDASADFTARKHVRIALDDDGNVRTWIGSRAQLRVWSEGPEATLTSSGTSNNTVSFGHRASGTADSDWYFVGLARDGVDFYAPSSTATPAEEWTNPDDLRGRDFTALPRFVAEGLSLASVDGPARIGDRWTVGSSSVYSGGNVASVESPSPSRAWRSIADGTEMIFAWDLDAIGTSSEFDCDSVGAFALQTNIREFYVETYDGASWSTLIHAEAYDAFSGLKYGRKGAVVSVDTGQSQTGDRYLFREMHAGDTFDTGATDPVVLRKIAHNTEGAWTDSTTVRPRLTLDPAGLTGAEPSSGTGRIWRREFGGVAHNASGFQAIRLRIPAHKTADGYYKIGAFVLGPVVVFGTPVDFGHSLTIERNVERFTRPDGVRAERVLGRPRRVIEFAIANGAVDLTNVQVGTPVPHYVTADGSTPVAAVADTSRQILGAVLRAADARAAAVYIGRLEQLSGSSSEQISEPYRFLYGRLVSDPRVENVLGYEDYNEAERLSTVSIEEEI